VKLYENYLPKAKAKGKYHARTANERTLKIEDIASLIVERRGTRWKYEELVEVFHLFCREIAFQLCDGYAVNLDDLFALYPHVKGVFDRLKEGITEDAHPLTFHFRLLRALYEVAEHIQINVIGLAGSGAYLDTFTDVESTLVNQKVTPGGQFITEGSKIRIEGPESGFFFTTGINPVIAVPVTATLAINEPHRIIGIIPELLPDKLWTPEIRTHYTGGAVPLKELRVIRADFTVSM
jgi:hypothetical protein